jgi:MHS family proline/betaine transporter-like MFS transporter
MLQAFVVSAIGYVASYTFVVYLVSYAIQALHLPPSTAFACAVASSMVLLITTPLVGALTDRIGRRPPILACALLNLVFDYPLFMLAVHGGTFASLLAALLIYACFQGLYTGTIPSILAEMFPTRVRYTGLSLSYGFAVVLFGGSLSAVAVLSMKEYRNVSLE